MSKNGSIVQKFHTWHQTPKGLVAFAAIELVLAYLFVSLAIDSGSLWYYALALVLLVGCSQNIVRLLTRLLTKKK